MKQQQIDEIIEGIKANQYIRSTKTHKWVDQDGPYDNPETCVREFIWNGFAYLMASKMWVEDPVQNLRLPEWMRAPWGTYPPTPPKPPKNK